MSTSRSKPFSLVHLAFVGDSDISRWPIELLPTVPADQNTSFDPSVHVSGHSGATLDQIVPYVKSMVNQVVVNDGKFDKSNNNEKKSSNERLLLLVACAGENDIGNGFSLDDTLKSFQSLLNSYFMEVSTTQSSSGGALSSSWTRKLIFLGPKLEPWLVDDHTSRKQYIKLSKAFQRSCEKHEFADNIIFLDCITMFCGDSANVPGALFGGKAHADPKYFSDDKLHLNSEGYKIWQQKLESIIIKELSDAC